MRTEIVSTLKRKATKIITDLNKTREPILITQHGKPAAYLIDVEDYDFMQRRMQILEGITRGELTISENRVHTHTEAKRKMKKWLK